MEKFLDYYLNLPWSYRFDWDDEDKIYVASVIELEGCNSHGKTVQEAQEMIKDALHSYIETLLHFGDPIPEPVNKSEFKGKIPYRTSPEKHYKLAQKAQRSKKSINKLIDEAVDNLLAS